MTKGTPLLYNKAKLTKINGLFMKVSARSNKSDSTDHLLFIGHLFMTPMPFEQNKHADPQ